MNDLASISLQQHKKYKGKLEVNPTVPLNNMEDMTVFYSPGVAQPCREIHKNPEDAYEYTIKGSTIAVISDGTAVLGLGDIGALAAMPVMEGKCALFKKFGGINAVPICLDEKDPAKLIEIIKALAPNYGGINLEDISAPRCFEIEEALIEALDIPVFHDDQHGTAIICLAGLINALKVVGKKVEEVKIVISGAGAAGIAITKLFLKYGFKHISLQDSRGLIYEGREGLNKYKEDIAKVTNLEGIQGGLENAVVGSDIFIGVSKPDILTKEMVSSMNKDAIIFAMSNPNPEIMPEDALAAGAKIVATGRSDYPNQVNNVMVFPGVLKGALEGRVPKITNDMKINAAISLAGIVENPTTEMIIPDVFDERVADIVANAVKGN